MLDRTIPFYNIILRCDSFKHLDVSLPDGFRIVPYQRGFETDWARLECQIEDFGSEEEARLYFCTTYLQDPTKQSNILFCMNQENRVVGSCIAWEDMRGDGVVASLHWLVVDEEYQRKGIGEALCRAVLDIFSEEKKCPVYIHTQPWSWKAILLYTKLGFKIQKKDSFSHYRNEYEKAMNTIKMVMPSIAFERIAMESEE